MRLLVILIFIAGCTTKTATSEPKEVKGEPELKAYCSLIKDYRNELYKSGWSMRTADTRTQRNIHVLYRMQISEARDVAAKLLGKDLQLHDIALLQGFASIECCKIGDSFFKEAQGRCYVNY